METQQKTSIHDYIHNWNNHINELSRLAWNLSEKDYNKLKEIQNELEILMQKACKNLIESRMKKK